VWAISRLTLLLKSTRLMFEHGWNEDGVIRCEGGGIAHTLLGVYHRSRKGDGNDLLSQEGEACRIEVLLLFLAKDTKAVEPVKMILPEGIDASCSYRVATCCVFFHFLIDTLM
jgi:hypothetical protein